jgi:hypothetical protein
VETVRLVGGPFDGAEWHAPENGQTIFVPRTEVLEPPVRYDRDGDVFRYVS